LKSGKHIIQEANTRENTKSMPKPFIDTMVEEFDNIASGIENVEKELQISEYFY
jgi:hypothetical protein